jgi:hypothetical protein
VADDEPLASGFEAILRCALALVIVQDAMTLRDDAAGQVVQPDAPQVDLSNIQKPGFPGLAGRAGFKKPGF